MAKVVRLGRAPRLVAALCALIVAITDIAPHRHAESALELSFIDAVDGAETHVIACDGLPSGATHLHRDRVVQVHPCVACLRQHVQAIALNDIVRTPQTLHQFLITAAWVSHARTIRLRKSSRAPPILTS
jgi:hypothetical protein